MQSFSVNCKQFILIWKMKGILRFVSMYTHTHTHISTQLFTILHHSLSCNLLVFSGTAHMPWMEIGGGPRVEKERDSEREKHVFEKKNEQVNNAKPMNNVLNEGDGLWNVCGYTDTEFNTCIKKTRLFVYAFFFTTRKLTIPFIWKPYQCDCTRKLIQWKGILVKDAHTI